VFIGVHRRRISDHGEALPRVRRSRRQRRSHSAGAIINGGEGPMKETTQNLD